MLKTRTLERLARANPIPVSRANELAAPMGLRGRVRDAIARDVLETVGREARSRRRGEARGRRRLAIAVAIPLAALASVPFVGARLLDLFWTSGTPVAPADLGPMDRWLLDDVAGGGATVSRIASDGVLSFYVIRARDGRMCVASGPAGGRPVLGSTGCTTAQGLRNALPGPGHPLYAETAGMLEPRTGSATITSVVGLADTGVTRVELRSAAGAPLGSAPVTDHVFELRNLSAAPPVSLVAVDRDGRSYFTKRLR